MISLKLLLEERFKEKNRSKLFKSNISEQTIKPPEPADNTLVSRDYLQLPNDLKVTTDSDPMSPENSKESDEVMSNLITDWKDLCTLIDPYHGSKLTKSDWYERTNEDGHVTLDLPDDMHTMVGDFANKFSFDFMTAHKNGEIKGPDSLKNKQIYIMPLITSAYRPPHRQIDAVYLQYKGASNYPLRYKKPFGVTIKTIFDRTNLKDEDSKYLSPADAKRKAIEFLKDMEAMDPPQYMSNHQTKGAIDIALTNNREYNNWIHDYLTGLKASKKIGNYIDERDEPRPHFHIRISGGE